MVPGLKSLGLMFVTLAVISTSRLLSSQVKPPTCANCAVWNAPQRPFRIYGNTYYVGPHGLSSILIVSDQGDVLIDGALPESAQLIAANIQKLGFKIQDVKLIVNSHVHFDHAGGIAELQRLSGASVVASPWSATVLTSGGVAKDDPQYGTIRGIAPVAGVKTLHDGEELKVGSIAITAHSTPGHTRGGTTWTWRSCKAHRCMNMVYADSISAVSTDGFKFSNNNTDPNAVADFKKSFAFLDTVPCDILITPHPEAADLWERLERRSRRVPGSLVDNTRCRQLAQMGRQALQKRLATEAAH